MADCSGFRVAVDASEVVDVRYKFFIYVNFSHDKKISDIESRISEILHLKGPISLMIDECFLPSAENVRLVHTGDVLKIVPRCEQNNEPTLLELLSADDVRKQKAKQKEKKKKKEQLEYCECDKGKTNGICVKEEDNEIVPRCEQNNEPTPLELLSADDVRKQKAKQKEEKKKKKEQLEYCECDKVKTNGICVKEEDNETVPMEVDGLPSKHKQRSSAVDEVDNCEVKENRKRSKNSSCVEEAETVATDQEDHKRRRKRVRRHKKKTEPRPSPQVWRQAKPSVLVQAPRVHIRYSSEDDKTDDITVVAEVHKPPASPEQGTVCPQVSPQRTLSSKWDLQTEDPFAKLLAIVSPQVYKRTAPPDEKSTIRQTVDFTKFLLIKDCPRKGDIIAFKMLKMSQDYTPQISDYIVAQVSSVEEGTFQLVLQVIDGQEECFTPKGKFCLEEEEDAVTIKDNSLHLNWNEMVETRLVHP